ncbi:MAG: KH domain-containing protein [Candidatus Micrarchaeia archaeon]|jgi:ribosomal RNA assembly protein
MDTIKVPQKRIKAYKDKDGAVLKRLKDDLGVDIKLEDGDIEIEGDGGAVWVASMVVNAINYGFAPEKAYKLFDDEYYLEVIDLDTFFAGSEKLIERYLARVIGQEGKAKKVLEDLSEAHISVWEHKIAIIGTFEELHDAREAINRLLMGSTHAGVYSYLERNKKLRRMPR